MLWRAVVVVFGICARGARALLSCSSLNVLGGAEEGKAVEVALGKVGICRTGDVDEAQVHKSCSFYALFNDIDRYLVHG